jgi:hypothetical protein
MKGMSVIIYNMELKRMKRGSTSNGNVVKVSLTEQWLQMETRTQAYVRINSLMKNINDGQT